MTAPCEFCDLAHGDDYAFCCCCGNEVGPTYPAGRHSAGCPKVLVARAIRAEDRWEAER